MATFKVSYRVFGETTSYEKGAGPNQVGKRHVNPSVFADVVFYQRGEIGQSGNWQVPMKEVKGHIRKEIGDAFYQFNEITKLTPNVSVVKLEEVSA